MKPTKYAAIFLILCGPAFAQEAANTGATAPRPAKVITVQTSETTTSRRYPAIVLPSQEAELTFKVSGQVIDLPLRASTEVAEGDVIASLDTAPFEAQIVQLQSQRDQAQSQLDALLTGARPQEIAALQAAVDAAEAQFDQAQDQARRTRELTERGVAAKAMLDADEATARVALSQLDAAEEQLELGREGARAEEIAAARAALRGLDSQIAQAQDNLDDAVLRAPFSGIIARRDIERFSNIQAGQSIVLLQALETVNLVFDIPGPDVLVFSAAEDTGAQVELDAMPGQLIQAELIEFSTQADAGTQTYRAQVAIAVPDGSQVLPGMVGDVIVSSASAEAARISVPITAIASASDGAALVWVVANDTNAVAARSVVLGSVNGDQVVVAEGLAASERIVTAGVSHLREGAVIRPIAKVGE